MFLRTELHNLGLVLQESHHGVEAGSDLDEEMDKVFAMGSSEVKFDVSRLSTSPGDAASDRRKFEDRDLSRKWIWSI